MKTKLEEKYNENVCWHVIVGRNFGGFVTYQDKMHVYFYIGQTGFLVFATVLITFNFYSHLFKNAQ